MATVDLAVFDAYEAALQKLQAANDAFAEGDLKGLDHSRAREAALSEALVSLAKGYGVKLNPDGSRYIDSNGEFNIYAVSESQPATHWDKATGRYGEFAAVLNAHSPRTGILRGALLSEGSSWCYMNHFDVEKMVVGQREAMAARRAIAEQAQEAVGDEQSTADRPRER